MQVAVAVAEMGARAAPAEMVAVEQVLQAAHIHSHSVLIPVKHNQAPQTLAEVVEVRHTVVLVAPELVEAA
jgi:hypothetical protein